MKRRMANCLQCNQPVPGNRILYCTDYCAQQAQIEKDAERTHNAAGFSFESLAYAGLMYEHPEERE